MLLFLLSSLLLLSPISTKRTYPNKCETCIEMVAYIIQEVNMEARDKPEPVKMELTSTMMQALEVYCFHYVGGREATCSDFTNMIRKGDLFDILAKSTKKCRVQMKDISIGSKTTGSKATEMFWGCPSAPDCICLNLRQCDSLKQESVSLSQHAECSDLDAYALEEFTDIFTKIHFTAFDSDIL